MTELRPEPLQKMHKPGFKTMPAVKFPGKFTLPDTPKPSVINKKAKPTVPVAAPKLDTDMPNKDIIFGAAVKRIKGGRDLKVRPNLGGRETMEAKSNEAQTVPFTINPEMLVLEGVGTNEAQTVPFTINPEMLVLEGVGTGEAQTVPFTINPEMLVLEGVGTNEAQTVPFTINPEMLVLEGTSVFPQ